MEELRSYTPEQQEISSIAKAFAHPVRIAILQKLLQQTACYHGDMAEELPIAKSTLSQHLHELKRAGLIHGEVNLPSVKYCIHNENWVKAKELFASLFHEIRLEDDCSC